MRAIATAARHPGSLFGAIPTKTAAVCARAGIGVPVTTIPRLKIRPTHPVRRRTPRALRPGPEAPRYPRSSIVDCAAYVDGHRVDVVPNTEGVTDALAVVRRSIRDIERGGLHRDAAEWPFVWVGLHEPDQRELEELAEIFGLHPLAVEDAVQAHQRPKLERYDDVLVAVLKTVRYVGHDRLTASSQIVESGEIMVFLGPDFVVTVRHGEHCGLRPVRRRLEESPELLQLGPAAVLHAVADHVVDDYLAATDALQVDIDEVETTVFSPQRTRDVERIYQLKRELIELKRAVTPLAQPLRALTTRSYRTVHPRIREYFRDVEDHLSRVREQVASFDELLTSILQASLAQMTMAENEDMRKISAWVAILAVPTMVAGLYGMNFDYMPELHWRYGYPLILGLIGTVCGLLYRGFRRNGWL
ncbi:MAG: magnesium/cobalt transporter CorA [Streptosporangiales bacterium]|nr:magnesium/cobalt transporter CorA [Streptosporangiales bacterium]